MHTSITRREFLACSAAVCGTLAATSAAAAASEPGQPVDLHVHLDNSTLDAVLALGQEKGVKFGIVEHAGTKENKYPVVLSNDEELGRYLDMLEAKPVFKGVQAEWTDWAGCFSRETLARLDYVLTDAMTFPAPDGRRMKLWEDVADLGDTATFMDRYVDWHVQILSEQPIDLFANVSWYPPVLGEYDTVWTDSRIERVVAAAAAKGVAIEISSGFQLPHERFLRMAKEAGLKFALGSNGRYPKMGSLDYSLQMAATLALTPENIFIPTKTRAA